MTIVSSNKININNYISSQTLDLKQEKANVEINIKKIDFYMDYCLIDINVNNKRKTPILLDSKEESGNIYLEDKFKIKYECENYNIDKIDLVIEADNNKDYTLKFDLPSNKRSDLTSLHFSKILSDYNQYKQIGDSRTISIEAQL